MTKKENSSINPQKSKDLNSFLNIKFLGVISLFLSLLTRWVLYDYDMLPEKQSIEFLLSFALVGGYLFVLIILSALLNSKNEEEQSEKQ